MGEISAEEVNGLGKRLNEMAVEEAQCRGETMQRLNALETGQVDHKNDIKELFKAVEVVKLGLTSLNSKLIGMGVVLMIVIPVITTYLSKVIFK